MMRESSKPLAKYSTEHWAVEVGSGSNNSQTAYDKWLDHWHDWCEHSFTGPFRIFGYSDWSGCMFVMWEFSDAALLKLKWDHPIQIDRVACR